MVWAARARRKWRYGRRKERWNRRTLVATAAVTVVLVPIRSYADPLPLSGSLKFPPLPPPSTAAGTEEFGQSISPLQGNYNTKRREYLQL